MLHSLRGSLLRKFMDSIVWVLGAFVLGGGMAVLMLTLLHVAGREEEQMTLAENASRNRDLGSQRR